MYSSPFCKRRRGYFYCYEFLSVSCFGVPRRNPRWHGHGGRYGHDSLIDFGGRRGAKNSAMREFICLFTDEFGRVKNTRRQPFIEDGRGGVDCGSRLAFIGDWYVGGGRVACGVFTHGIRRVFNRFSVGWRVSRFEKRLT